MTTHNWLSSEPQTFEIMQKKTFRQIKNSFAIHKLVWLHFQVGWASGLQFVFFRDKVSMYE